MQTGAAPGGARRGTYTSRMRIVVAGASGFIGGHLIDELLRHDVEPIAMVRPGSDAARLRELELEVVEVDVLDLDAVRPIMRRAEFVINAVQLTSPGLSGEAYDDVNVGGTTNLLDAAVEGGVGGFVQLSSTTMYGDGSAKPRWKRFASSAIWARARSNFSTTTAISISSRSTRGFRSNIR